MSKHASKKGRHVVVDLVGAPRTDRLLLTTLDARRLRGALERLPPRARSARAEELELLTDALESAVVVPPERMPPDVVTMRSRVVLKDVESSARREVALVYPVEGSAHEARVSVATPVGTALLGLAEGSVLGWPLPSGRTALLRVEAVPYQPERAGDFHL
jgi:regulator of nucleoside diphosphate kinase